MSSSVELRSAGLKATIPRVKILKLLQSSARRHMTAEDVFKELLATGNDVGLATIYRVLTQFESAGLVLRHNFEGDRAVYELASELHHDHMVCTECGSVQEFADCGIEKLQLEAADKQGFDISTHSLYLYGVCAECQQTVGNG